MHHTKENVSHCNIIWRFYLNSTVIGSEVFLLFWFNAALSSMQKRTSVSWNNAKICTVLNNLHFHLLTRTFFLNGLLCFSEIDYFITFTILWFFMPICRYSTMYVRTTIRQRQEEIPMHFNGIRGSCKFQRFSLKYSLTLYIFIFVFFPLL